MSLVQDIRSKNAGPFWITIDVFCADAAAFARLNSALTTAMVAQALNADLARVQRFRHCRTQRHKIQRATRSRPRLARGSRHARRVLCGADQGIGRRPLIDARKLQALVLKTGNSIEREVRACRLM